MPVLIERKKERKRKIRLRLRWERGWERVLTGVTSHLSNWAVRSIFVNRKPSDSRRINNSNNDRVKNVERERTRLFASGGRKVCEHERGCAGNY